MNRLITLTLFASLLAMTGCPKSTPDPDSDTPEDVSSDATDTEVPDSVAQDVQPDGAAPPDGAGSDSGPDPDAVPDPDGEPSDDVTDPTDSADGTDPTEDVGPVETSFQFWFIGSDSQSFAVGEDAVSLYPEDEHNDYTDPVSFPGFQMNVYVDAIGVETGAVVTLQVDNIPYPNQLLIAADGAGIVTFGNVTLPASSEGYEVIVTVQGPEDLVTASKTVSVLTGACQLAVTPIAENGCLIDSDGGAFDLPVTVSLTEGDCDQASLTYQIGATGAPTTLPTVALDAAGQAVFTLPLALDGAILEDTVTVDATVLHPTSAGLTGAASVVYDVDNGVPALTFSQPDGVIVTMLDLLSDKDGVDANGLQFDVYGTVTGLSGADVNSVSLSIDGTVVGSTTPSAGLYAFDGTTFTQDGPVTLSVAGTDACGNVGTASIGIDVYASRPGLTIVSPVSGDTLLAKSDGDLLTPLTHETTFEVAGTQLAADTPLTVECKSTGGAIAFTAIAPAFDAGDPSVDLSALAVALDTNQFGQAVTCQIAANGPNPATSNPVELSVALPAPSLAITEPTEGKQLTTKVVDVSGVADNLDGQPIELTVYAAGQIACALSGGTIAAGIVTAQFDLGTDCTGIVDGAYFLSFDAVDGLGNQISDLANSPTANVAFDTVPPGIVHNAPALLLDPVGNGAHTDTSAAAGYQTTFEFQMIDEVNIAGGEICLTVDDLPEAPPISATPGQHGPGCQVVDASGIATWTEVTLQPNNNDFEAWAYDSFGNASTVLADTVVLDFVGLAVSITDPDPSGGQVFVAESTLDVTVSVADSEDGSPIPEATVGLVLNDNSLAVSPTVVGDGTYLFSSIPLTGNGTVDAIVATASFGGIDGASSTLQVEFKTTQPSISLAALPFVLNLASVECAGTEADCLTTISGTTANVETGQTATLEVDCGAEQTKFHYTTSVAANGDISFEDVTLFHGSTCSLVGRVTDAADQEASTEGTPIQIVVDRLAPELVEFTDPPALEGAIGVLESLTVAGGDDASNDPGIQHALSVTVSGLEGGASVTALLEWVDEDTSESMSRTIVASLAESVPDGVLALLAFEDDGVDYINWPEGDVTVTITASDGAGNPAVDLVSAVQVQADAPLVSIQIPQTAGDACTTSEDCFEGACQQGLCWRKWNIAATKDLLLSVSGLSTTTDNLRICSNANGLASGGTLCDSDDGNGPYYVMGPLQSATNGTPAVQFNDEDLPKGFQTVIAEIQPDPGGPWFSTLLQSDPDNAKRRFYIDLDLPTVTSIVCDSDTVAPNMVLSYVEQKIDDGPQYAGGTFEFTVTADEDGASTVYVNGSAAASVVVEDGSAKFELLLLDEGISDIGVQVEDQAGNKSLDVDEEGAEISQYTVDTVIPLVEFLSPNAALLVQGDVLDVEVTCTKGCETGGTVVLSRAGEGQIANQPLVGATAVFDHATYGTLKQGDNDLTVYATDSAFNQGTVEATSVFVDTEPPSVSLTSLAGYALDSIPAPLDGQADDADPSSNAFEIATAFSVGAEATGWSIELASCTDDTYTTCLAPSVVAQGTVTGDADLDQDLGVPIVEATSHHMLTITVTDAVSGNVADVGNTAVVSQGFSVQVTGCLTGLTNLIAGDYYSIATGCPGGTPCSGTTLALTADYLACGDTVTHMRLYDGTTELALATDLTGGSASFNVPVSDGDSVDFNVTVFSGGVD
ncbi:MAG: hypothetical protein QF464_01475, partial [Myxococcota bacterium]|nr:hypothetical protein [Myxococcota bacterium]